MVWNRPRIGHKGPVRRSTPIDEIPFLAVARSLGDLWSYNSQLDEFVVSPEPDCSVIPIDTNAFRCLIFGTDGLYNMLSPQMAVHIVQQAEKHNENAALSDMPNKIWLNPSKCLVEKALERWSNTKMRADNTTVVTIMLDPPGPPRAQVLKNKKKNYSDSGLQIVTRYENQTEDNSNEENPLELPENICSSEPIPSSSEASYLQLSKKNPNSSIGEAEEEKPEISCSSQESANNVPETFENFDDSFLPKPRESLGFDPCSTNNIESSDCLLDNVSSQTSSDSKNTIDEENIQINEISSSSSDLDDSKSDDNTTAVAYSKMKITKRRSIGKTKRILNSSENFRQSEENKYMPHCSLPNEFPQSSSQKVSNNDEQLVSNSKSVYEHTSTKTKSDSETKFKETRNYLRNKSQENDIKQILSESPGNESHVITRSRKSNMAFQNKSDDATKENNTPKKELKKQTQANMHVLNFDLQTANNGRISRKRALESTEKVTIKRSKIQLIQNSTVLRKTTRQSVINATEPLKSNDKVKENQAQKNNNNKISVKNNTSKSVSLKNKQKQSKSDDIITDLPIPRTSKRILNISNVDIMPHIRSMRSGKEKQNETARVDKLKLPKKLQAKKGEKKKEHRPLLKPNKPNTRTNIVKIISTRSRK